MKRKWNNYLNKNKPGLFDCQLVSTLNAYYYLTGKIWCKQDSEEYERLIEVCKCRYGAAISIEKIHKIMGIKVIGYSNSIHFPEWTKKHQSYPQKKKPRLLNINPKQILPLPIEASIWHKRYGFHSVLIVDQCLKTDCLRITNFEWATSQQGWLFKEDMYQFDRINNPDMWSYRLLGMT